MYNKKLSDIFICPVCKTSRLYINKETLLCKNSDCIKSLNPFHIVNSKPVLINFEESAIDEDTFKNNVGKSIVKRRSSYITKVFRSLFLVIRKWKSCTVTWPQHYDHLEKVPDRPAQRPASSKTFQLMQPWMVTLPPWIRASEAVIIFDQIVLK